MNYKKQEIKRGINIHEIETDKFKTNLITVFLTTPITKENVTFNALIPAVLARGSKTMHTAKDISKELENMYGASFDCGVDKAGDNQVLKFYLESINNEYLPEDEDLLKKSIEKLFEIVFNPYIEENGFKNEYVDGEKENLKQIIDGKKDNKAAYAYTRCIEEMYKNKPYGLYKYGYVEDLNKINRNNLYEYYKKLINNAKIDIFVSGKNIENSIKIISEQMKEIDAREPDFIVNEKCEERKNDDIKVIKEDMDVAQGKLVIGLNVNVDTKESRYVALVYNAIFGGIPTSKLFQNVREKASLAYTASSSYLRQKNNIFVKCGIEVENYDKAVEIIKKQLEDMKLGNFEDEDIVSAKNNIISVVKSIPDEQDTRNNLLLWTGTC